MEDEELESEQGVPEPVDGDEAIHEEEQLADQDEDFLDPSDKKEGLDDEERRPVSKEVRKAVEFVHRQLGHPLEVHDAENDEVEWINGRGDSLC